MEYEKARESLEEACVLLPRKERDLLM
jgi:hypothetical protein